MIFGIKIGIINVEIQMTFLESDRFEAWIREEGRICLTDEELTELLHGKFDLENSDSYYEYTDPHIQSQWVAWIAAVKSTNLRRST